MAVPTITDQEFIDWVVSYFPSTWFAETEKVSGGGLYAHASAIATGDIALYTKIRLFYNSLTFTNAAGTQIDEIVKDYFGSKLPRLPGELDADYVTRVVTRLMLPVGTREGMRLAIVSTIKTAPLIQERRDLRNPCGWARWTPGNKLTAQTYGDFAWSRAGTVYYNIGAFQALITVNQPEPEDPSFLTFDQIMALIDSVKPEATIMWVRVIGPSSTGGEPIH